MSNKINTDDLRAMIDDDDLVDAEDDYWEMKAQQFANDQRFSNDGWDDEDDYDALDNVAEDLRAYVQQGLITEVEAEYLLRCSKRHFARNFGKRARSWLPS
jgi:hypothetical protein